MDTNKMRDTYEAWAIHDATSVGRELIIDREGDWYIGKDAQFLNLGWASWQASREAVVVELPPKWNDSTNSNKQSWDCGIEDARKAIEAQGLKVSP
ncbi:hypothetical protein D3C81_612970 [compost metagenome]